MLLECKALLTNNFFYTNLLTFFKNSDCHKFAFFNDGDPKLGHFDTFDMLFLFLAFVKGHMMA